MGAIDRFIVSTARYASTVFAGSYNDFDDLVQIGRIARWIASQRNSGSQRYIKGTIRHEIMNAAIASHYPVTANPRIKKKAIQVHNLLKAGASEEAIIQLLGITPAKLALLRRMAAPVKRQQDAA